MLRVKADNIPHLHVACVLVWGDTHTITQVQESQMVDLEKAPGEPGRLHGGIPIPISGWTNWRIRKMSVVRGWEVTSDIQVSPIHVCVDPSS